MKKEYVVDLLDEVPRDIVDKFTEERHNQSYFYSTVGYEDELSAWLLSHGYPKGERVLIKVSW